MTAVFPLLRLPFEELTEVLNNMDYLDKISFSLISKTTKSLILSLKLKAAYFSIFVGSTLKIHIQEEGVEYNWILCRGEVRISDVIDVVQEFDNDDIDGANYQWRNERLTVRDWIMHLKDVTNRVYIDGIIFEPEGEKFELDSIAKIIRGLDVKHLRADNDCSNAYHLNILKAIQTRMLTLSRNPFGDRLKIQEIIIENFDFLLFSLNRQIFLNELLVINAQYLELVLTGATWVKTLNQFFKLWRAGSNRRLKFMKIFYELGFVPDVEELLKGIHYEKYAGEKTRMFIQPAGADNAQFETHRNGGYDFDGHDGISATIFISEDIITEIFFSS